VRRYPGRAAAAAALLAAVLVAGFFAYHAHRRGQELRAERLQHALDAAVAAAMSGDLEQSEKALRAAELQHASTGQVRLLRGLVSLQRSELKPAIDNLEQAARLLPGSVAAHALLGTFYYRAGQWAKHDQQLQLLASLETVTPEDSLFKGYLESFQDPEVALQTLDEAVRWRNTGVAHAIRAETRARYALDWTDAALAALAQQDARVARSLLPANPFALSASVQAHLVAVILCRESGEESKRAAALAEMQSDVQELERFDQYPWVGVHRAQYFEQRGDSAAASEALRRAAQGFANNPAVFDYAADCYRRGELAQALAALARRKEKDDSEGDRLRACLLAEDKDHGPARARQAIQEWLERYPDPQNLGDAAVVLLLLGHKEQAQQIARRIRLPEGGSTSQRREFLVRSRAFVAGEDVSAADLLRAAQGVRSQRCSANFLIGMTHLADGERRAALEHFRAAVATGDYFNNDHTLSRVMLARLQDPAWPWWIVNKP
jgi:tetratricopeptide (TPR) repeat protein